MYLFSIQIEGQKWTIIFPVQIRTQYLLTHVGAILGHTIENCVIQS